MPPPVPPSVNDGRMIVGNPTIACTCFASSKECASALLGLASPIFAIAFLNFSRSSALSMASRLAPIISTANLSSTPSRARSSAQFNARLPPIVGSSASGAPSR
jgi:hypothetical protein